MRRSNASACALQAPTMHARTIVAVSSYREKSTGRSHRMQISKQVTCKSTCLLLP